MARCQFNYSFLKEQKLPLLIQPQIEEHVDFNYLVQFLKEDNEVMQEHLQNYGALLFRGFNVNTPDQFFDVIQASSLGPNYKYDFCTVPRTKLREGVFTSSNLPENLNLALHNEKSYSSEFPSHVFFNCNIAPETGGYTALADGHDIWFSLPEFLQKKMQSKGILYRKHYYGDQLKHRIIQLLVKPSIYKTWMDEFQTNEKYKVEELLSQLGEHFKWQGNDLITNKFLPACKNHPVTGKLVWFNQSNQLNSYSNGFSEYVKQLTKNPIARYILLHKSLHPYIAFYGDGTSITKKEADYINDAFQKNTILMPWQRGDVLILDNYSCLHGKTPHTGNRLILAGMTKYPYFEG